MDPLNIIKKEEEDIAREFNDDPTHMAIIVDKNNKKMEAICKDINDTVDCHFSIT